MTFEELYDTYRHRIWTYLYYLNNEEHPELCDDLTAETFEKAYFAFKRTARRKRFFRSYNWLKRIAKNTFISYLRKKQVRPQTVPQDKARHLTQPGPWLEDSIADKLLIEDTLARLPRSSRETLIHRYLLDKSLPELATLWNCSPNAAQQRIKRALARAGKQQPL